MVWFSYLPFITVDVIICFFIPPQALCKREPISMLVLYSIREEKETCKIPAQIVLALTESNVMFQEFLNRYT